MPATPPPTEPDMSSPSSSRIDNRNARSLLVETVSLNYEHFSDSFLTCPTCLSTYDNELRRPKLLPCSHTVCVSCLQHIADTGYRGTFKCPICREIVSLPRGGVAALTPSFVVNQLLELMSQRPKDILPQCTEHSQQELLFCEPCDAVFCPECSPGAHQDRALVAGTHTVLPFSVAIKRMNEILTHKAQLCQQGLGSAARAVQQELNQLSVAESTCSEEVDRSFQQLFVVLEMRRRDILTRLRDTADTKRKELQEQLRLIQAETNKVEDTCAEAQQQMEVRGVTTRIASLGEQQSMCESLAEPRANAFISYETQHNDAFKQLEKTINEFGRIRTSTTYPALCTLDCESPITNLRCTATLTAYDFKANKQNSGGDPVTASISCSDGSAPEVRVKDKQNGSYVIEFTPRTSGALTLHVCVFGRHVKSSPMQLTVSAHIDPEARWGVRGTGPDGLRQPVCVRSLGTDMLVLDTGNSRIKKLSSEGETLQVIDSNALQTQSCTGLWLQSADRWYISNWRTCAVHVLDSQGAECERITHTRLKEPTALAVNSHNEVYVADNQLCEVFVFSSHGGLITTIGRRGDQPGEFSHIADITVGRSEAVIVADVRLQMFTRQGRLLRDIGRHVNRSRGQYGGVTVDANGYLLASRSERGQSFIQVFAPNFQWMFNIDSSSDRLRRPSHLSVCQHNTRVLVADLGNDCIKKYRYR